jgi:hypothetical protein
MRAAARAALHVFHEIQTEFRKIYRLTVHKLIGSRLCRHYHPLQFHNRLLRLLRRDRIVCPRVRDHDAALIEW